MYHKVIAKTRRYQKSLVKLLVCVKRYELREGSAAIEVKVAKNRPYLETRILQ
jgi:hypothetical protein